MKKIALTGLLAAVALLGPTGIANADDSLYLQVIDQQSFASNFTDQELLNEGNKVCRYAGSRSTTDLAQMVSNDLGISLIAGGELVGAAEAGLGRHLLWSHRTGPRWRVKVCADRTFVPPIRTSHCRASLSSNSIHA
jgi:hypothetical protein